MTLLDAFELAWWHYCAIMWLIYCVIAWGVALRLYLPTLRESRSIWAHAASLIGILVGPGGMLVLLLWVAIRGARAFPVPERD